MDSWKGIEMASADNTSVMHVPSSEDSRWRLRVGLHSERGTRERNDDYGNWLEDADVFALADGIGGAPFGDVMARVAVNAALNGWRMAHAYDDEGNVLCDRVREGLSPQLYHTRAMFEQADIWIGDTKTLLDERGCGTTLVTAACEGDELVIGSVGDTGAFRLRDGVLERLNPVGRAGEGTNALASALGGRSGADPALWSGALADGDVYLLATDGIWAHATHDEMVRVLVQGMPNAPRMAHDLAASTVWRDNATALVIVVQRLEGDEA